MSENSSKRMKAKAAERPQLMNFSIKSGSHVASESKLIEELASFHKPRRTDEFIEELEIQEHLIDLWVVLRKIARTVAIFTAITMVLPGMKNGIFTISPYRPAVLMLLNAIIKHSLDSLAEGAEGDEVQVFIGSPLTPISLYINLAFFIAVLISLPVIIKELMAFLKPALTEEEYVILKQLSRYAAILFILGGVISYFVIMPITLKILTLSGGVVGEKSLLQMYSLSSILNLLLWGTLGGGLLYATPIILVVLVNLEIIEPDQLAERRREIIMAIFIIAAIVTPDPTMVSMVILSVPLIIIVEIMISWSYKIELNKFLMKSNEVTTW